MVAAAVRSTPSGSGATAFSCTQTWVAKHDGAKAITRSPSRNRAQPGPVRTTTPEHSMPSVGPAKPSSSASSGSRPWAHMMSRKFRPAATTSISISPIP